jgi:hypothetical protein
MAKGKLNSRSMEDVIIPKRLSFFGATQRDVQEVALMRYGPSIQAILGAVLLTCLCCSAKSQSVQIQVSDYHERPIVGTILSGKGVGTSTCNPTDVAGKTQIIAPSGAQPGDSLPLVLVRAPKPTMIIMSPFEGRATIPRSPGFIEVILGTPGDPWALKDVRVAWSWTAAIVQMNKESFQPQENLGRVAKSAGFTPMQIDTAIRTAAAKDATDSYRRALAAEYTREYRPLA